MSQEIARQRRRRRRKRARAQAALVLEVGAELARHFAELDLSLLPTGSGAIRAFQEAYAQAGETLP